MSVILQWWGMAKSKKDIQSLLDCRDHVYMYSSSWKFLPFKSSCFPLLLSLLWLTSMCFKQIDSKRNWPRVVSGYGKGWHITVTAPISVECHSFLNICNWMQRICFVLSMILKILCSTLLCLLFTTFLTLRWVLSRSSKCFLAKSAMTGSNSTACTDTLKVRLSNSAKIPPPSPISIPFEEPSFLNLLPAMHLPTETFFFEI